VPAQPTPEASCVVGNVQRVAIVGSGGAGKSTLARELGQRLGLPVIHLDQRFWRPGWLETETEEWAATQQELAAADRWIRDGNYGATLDVRLAGRAVRAEGCEEQIGSVGSAFSTGSTLSVGSIPSAASLLDVMSSRASARRDGYRWCTSQVMPWNSR
jgi:hypothetical protein